MKLERTVLLVCGPPGAGKTTTARDLAASLGLTVYDLDDPHWHQSEAMFRAGIRHLRYDPEARAVVIRAGAHLDARRTWARTIGATNTHTMATSYDLCRSRILTRNRTRPPIAHQLAALAQWWATYEPDPDPTPSSPPSLPITPTGGTGMPDPALAMANTWDQMVDTLHHYASLAAGMAPDPADPIHTALADAAALARHHRARAAQDAATH